MRAFFVTVGALFALLVAGPAAARAQSTAAAQRTLRSQLDRGINNVGGYDGAYVIDLSTGHALYSYAGSARFLPASVEKLYTTSTALLRFGPNGSLTTSVLGQGVRRLGTWYGTLYLRGGGDPTFGSVGFDQYAYGTGATMRSLILGLRRAGIRALRGRVVGDESYFDSLRGTAPYGYQFSTDIEGSLSALAFNRGLTAGGGDYIVHPSLFAAQQFVSTFQNSGANVPARTPIYTGATPRGARPLAVVRSPRMATLIQLTNTPSDNFFAEMLVKGIGARFGAGGNTAAGAGVVQSELARRFGIYPSLDDGSGLSRDDSTSPRQVVRLLAQMAHNRPFLDSLAIAGETGTLQHRLQGTYAQGRCRGKTGTLHDVANTVGYCHSRDGHTLAFAFFFNSIGDPDYGHAVEANMVVALAKYNG